MSWNLIALNRKPLAGFDIFYRYYTVGLDRSDGAYFSFNSLVILDNESRLALAFQVEFSLNSIYAKAIKQATS